jgi:6-phosphogluconolactonase
MTCVKPHVVASRGREDWAEMAAREIQVAIESSISERGACNLMLTGGSTAEELYSYWARSRQLLGCSIKFYFGDERCVPPEHSDSNFGMVKSALWSGILPAGVSVQRMRAEVADPDHAAREYEHLLPEAIDVLLLGMGEDGHVASLFPSSSALRVRDRSVVFATGPKAPHSRLTITPKVIKRARSIFLLALGAEKGRTLAMALRKAADEDSFPVRLALAGTWLLDHAAFSELESFRGR